MAHAFTQGFGKRALVTCLLFGWNVIVSAQEFSEPRKHSLSTAVRFLNDFQWGSPWGGALEAIVGPWLTLGEGSARPRGYISKLFDGDVGSLAEPTGSVLIFDGPHVVIDVVVPTWREVGKVEFFAFELTQKTQAHARLSFVDANGRLSRVPLVRRVLEEKERLAHVAYVADGLSFRNGKFSFTYENTDLGGAFIAEISLDDMRPRLSSANFKAGVLGERAKSECFPRDSEFPGWRKWLQSPHGRRGAKSRLVYWHRPSEESNDQYSADSLIVQVSRNGDRLFDLAGAWFVSSLPIKAAVPLVVVVGDASTPFSGMELVGLSGDSERAVALRLARLGLAVLVIEPPAASCLSSGSKCILNRIEGILDVVTSSEVRRRPASFSQATGRVIVPGRLGIWGVEGGAIVAAMAASNGSKQFDAAALSRVDLAMIEKMQDIENCPQGRPPSPGRLPRWANNGTAVWISGDGGKAIVDLDPMALENSVPVVHWSTASPVFSAQEIEAVGNFFLENLVMRKQKAAKSSSELLIAPYRAQSSGKEAAGSGYNFLYKRR